MITKLNMQNFKAWKKISDMRLAPITAIFGTNSSGKTSILQLLLLIRQTVESSDRLQVLNFGDGQILANLGSFNETVHGSNTNEAISFGLEWTMKKELKINNPSNSAAPNALLFSGKSMDFETTIQEFESRTMSVREMSYGFDNHKFSMRQKGTNLKNYDLLCSDGDFTFVRSQGRAWPLPPPVKCYGFPDQVKAYYQNAGFLSDFQLRLEELVSSIYYLGPLRDHPHRRYTWSGSEPVDMGRRGEKAIEALLAANARNVTISQGKGIPKVSVEEYVAKWLKELGLIHSFSVVRIAKDDPSYRVVVKKNEQSTAVLITDVGFGVSQILPVLVLCFSVPPGSVIVLEQPEIHLHPSVQSRLADVFIDAINKNRVQIILESHSEHLLRRLQRRIAEKGLKQDATALYFCDAQGGESKLEPLHVDKFGAITNWPKDFFGDEFAEMAAITKATMNRKKVGEK